LIDWITNRPMKFAHWSVPAGKVTTWHTYMWRANAACYPQREMKSN